MAAVFVGIALAFSAGLTGRATTSFAQTVVTWGNSGPIYRTYRPRARYRRNVTRRARRPSTRRPSRGAQNRSARREAGKQKQQAKTLLLPDKAKDDAATQQIIVSLARQKLTVYHDGKPVGTTRISSGMKGFETPQGIFSIIQKRRRHYSNIYRGAPMPFMQRLTWSGIALHQGVVPGYRASHGCIRLPAAFAKSLFGFTEQRAHVIVTRTNPKPKPIAHPALFQPTPTPPPDDRQAHQSEAVPSNDQAAQRYAENLAGRTTATDAMPNTIPGALAGAIPTTPAKTTQARQTTTSDNPLHGWDDIELEAHRQLMRTHKSQSPIRILITRRSGRHRISEAQNLLAGFGYDPGPADGLIGKQTVVAIKAFQADQDLPVTGYPNDEFYAALNGKAGISEDATAFIYVRQDQKDIFHAPINIKQPEAPLGAHLFVVTALDEARGHANWHATSIPTNGYSWRQPGTRNKADEEQSETGGELLRIGADEVLNRIVLPNHVRMRIEDILTPKSSLIIADGGHTRETGKDTDFIVLTR